MVRRLRNSVHHWSKARSNKAPWVLAEEASEGPHEERANAAQVALNPDKASWIAGYDLEVGCGWRNKVGGKQEDRQMSLAINDDGSRDDDECIELEFEGVTRCGY